MTRCGLVSSDVNAARLARGHVLQRERARAAQTSPDGDPTVGTKKRYTSTPFVYAQNGETVTYVVNEQWCGNATETEPGDPPSCERVVKAREFRYDGARQRYLDRKLDPCDFQSGVITPLESGTTWTDYDGDEPVADYTISATGVVTEKRAFELGVGRVEPWTDGSLGVGESNTAYYHADMLGTTRMMTNSSGASINAPVFTAFGEKVAGTLDGSSNRYGYVGAFGYQAHDDMSFLHVGARYYDPGSGRFLQRDPIGVRGGLNVFSYAVGQPSTRIDPSGLVPTWVAKAGGPPWWFVGMLVCAVAEKIVVPAIDKWADDNYKEGMEEINNPKPKPPPPPPTPMPPLGQLTGGMLG